MDAEHADASKASARLVFVLSSLASILSHSSHPPPHTKALLTADEQQDLRSYFNASDPSLELPVLLIDLQRELDELQQLPAASEDSSVRSNLDAARDLLFQLRSMFHHDNTSLPSNSNTGAGPPSPAPSIPSPTHHLPSSSSSMAASMISEEHSKKLANRISELEQIQNELTAELLSTQSECERLKGLVSMQQDLLHKHVDGHAQQIEALAQKQTTLDAVAQTVKSLYDEVDAWQNEVVRLQKQCSDLQTKSLQLDLASHAKMAQLDAEFANISNSAGTNVSHRARAERNLKEISHEIGILQQTNNELLGRNESLQANYDAMYAHAKDMSAKADALYRRLADSEDETVRLKHENRQLRDELAGVRDAAGVVRSLEAEVADARAKLDRMARQMHEQNALIMEQTRAVLFEDVLPFAEQCCAETNRLTHTLCKSLGIPIPTSSSSNTAAGAAAAYSALANSSSALQTSTNELSRVIEEMVAAVQQQIKSTAGVTSGALDGLKAEYDELVRVQSLKNEAFERLVQNVAHVREELDKEAVSVADEASALKREVQRLQGQLAQVRESSEATNAAYVQLKDEYAAMTRNVDSERTLTDEEISGARELLQKERTLTAKLQERVRELEAEKQQLQEKIKQLEVEVRKRDASNRLSQEDMEKETRDLKARIDKSSTSQNAQGGSRLQGIVQRRMQQGVFKMTGAVNDQQQPQPQQQGSKATT
jgi:chromosome segregation ATPase